jgi:hypothetical protein
MIRIDMSEFMERFSVSRLIGAPPGNDLGTVVNVVAVHDRVMSLSRNESR